MTSMLSYDESYYAADAIGLLNHFQLTPFFQGNQGRESSWIYLLAGIWTRQQRTAGTNIPYQLMTLTPNIEVIDNGVLPDYILGDRIELRTDLPPQARASRGDIMVVALRMRALQPLDKPYSVFMHLYAIDAMGIIDDGHKWAQGGAQMCATYPTTLWRAEENIMQSFRLTILSDLPAGSYVVAMGVYEAGPNGARLPVTEAQDNKPYSYEVLQHVQVGP